MSNEPITSPPEPQNLQHDGNEPTTPLAERKFFTIDEVAQFLHVSRRTVDQLVRSRELKSHRIRGNRRISREHLDEYIAQAEKDDRPARGERHRESGRQPRRNRTTTNA